MSCIGVKLRFKKNEHIYKMRNKMNMQNEKIK